MDFEWLHEKFGLQKKGEEKMNSRKALRRTKIVCTIGPATSSDAQVRQPIRAGMDVAPLNFSHGDHDSHRETLRRLRQTSRELGKDPGIL